MTLLEGNVEGWVAIVCVCSMHIRTALDQLNHNFQIAVLAGNVETCLAIVSCIHISAPENCTMNLVVIAVDGSFDELLCSVVFLQFLVDAFTDTEGDIEEETDAGSYEVDWSKC